MKLDGAKLLIDEALGVSPSNETGHTSSGPSRSTQSGSVLKLSSQKGKMSVMIVLLSSNLDCPAKCHVQISKQIYC